MTSANTWPGPTDGSWSISPTIRRAASSGTAFISACISMTSTMEASSTTSRSQSSGLSLSRLKPPPLGSTSSSRWMVLASNPVASVMRLAARPVGAQRSSFAPFGREHLQDRLDDGGLADTGAAGDDEHLGDQRQADRRLLAVGKLQAAALLDPWQGLVRVDPGPGEPAVRRAASAARRCRVRPGRDPPETRTGVSPTISAMTVPSDSSRSRAVRISSCGTSSNSFGERNQLFGRQVRNGPRPWPRSGQRRYRRAPGSWRSSRCRVSWRSRRRS